MRYQIGKPYESDPIGQSQKLKPIDYDIPTYEQNLRYLKLLNTESLPLFEKSLEIRKRIKKLYEDPKFYSPW